MKKNICYSMYCAQGLAGRGVQQDDLMIIAPITGRQQKIRLDRTRYCLRSRGGLPGRQNAYEILLPKLEGHPDFSVEISWISFSTDPLLGIYFAECIGGLPLKINGQWGLEFYIEKGDQIQIGHNVLTFLPANHLKVQKAENFHQLLDPQLLQRGPLIPIVIEGETGTGKTQMAKQIHEAGGRGGPFVHLNLSAFNANLLESELFGHAKGAFTGAIFEKKGAIASADRGTLFLDEIDSLPLPIQVKLLLFLDELKFRPVGKSFEIQVNCRPVFASGRPLQTCVNEKTMREDFYYRLKSGLSYKLPALRKNPELIEEFCQDYLGKQFISISAELLSFYKGLPWSGNYRQLKAHLGKKILYSKSKKLEFDFHDKELINETSPVEGATSEDNIISLAELKRIYAQKALVQKKGLYEIAARELCISSKTLKRLVPPSQWPKLKSQMPKISTI